MTCASFYVLMIIMSASSLNAQNMKFGSPVNKAPFKAIQLKDSVRAMWSNYFPSTVKSKKKIHDKLQKQYHPESHKFFTYEHFPRNPNYTEKFPPAIKMKTEYEEPMVKNGPPNVTKKSADANAYYDCRLQQYPSPYTLQYESQTNNQKPLPQQSSYQQPNIYNVYQYPYGNMEYPAYQVPPQYLPQGPQGSQYMSYQQQQQQQQPLWPVQFDAERQVYQPAPVNPYPPPEIQYLPEGRPYQTPVQQIQWPWQSEEEKRVGNTVEQFEKVDFKTGEKRKSSCNKIQMYQAVPANPYQAPESQYLPPGQPYQTAQWPWSSEDERRAYENFFLGNGAVLSRNMGGQMGGPGAHGQSDGRPETQNMGYEPRANNFEPDLYPNVLSPVEVPDYNRRNSTVIYPSPQEFSYQYYGVPHRLAKRDESTRRSLQYPKCFVVSDKKKRSDKEVKLPYWPLLGTFGKLNPKNTREGRGGDIGKSSLVCLADTTRNLEMNIVRKLSELKAKEHMAEERRQTTMHRTEQAKEDFQEKIGDQMSLLSEARKADISAKEALGKVVRLERDLAREDKCLHRLKEEEDALYQDLLQSEAKVAMADMQIIPRLPTADDLTEFLTG